jgi:hypothetical protein
MKKIALLLMFFGFIIGLKGQNWGITYGFTCVSFTGSELVDPHYRLNIFLALDKFYPINDKQMIYSDLAWLFAGCSQTINGTKQKIRHGGIHLGLSYKYKFIKDESGKGWYLYTGPAFRIFSSGNETVLLKKDNIEKMQSIDYKFFYVDWLLGCGYDLSDKFGVEFRYNIGLSSVTKDASIHNSIFYLNFTFRPQF